MANCQNQNKKSVIPLMTEPPQLFNVNIKGNLSTNSHELIQQGIETLIPKIPKTLITKTVNNE